MFIKLKTLFALLLLISLHSLSAQNEDAGSTGFNTLKLIYGARSMAMGAGGIGIPANHEGLNQNPATILRAEQQSLSSTFMDHLVGSGGGRISYVYPKNIYEAYAAAISYWNSGAMDRTELSSTGELVETGETFGAQSMVAEVSASRFVSPALDIGASLKFIYDSIDGYSASAAMVDLGALHHTANPKIKVGLALRNVGFQTSYYTDSKFKEHLPLTYGAGLSMQMQENLLGAIDVGKANGENITLKLGMEYGISDAFTLRGGFRSNAGDYQMGGIAGYTSGISLGLGWKIRSWNLDYAVASYGDLGISNQLSLRYNLSN